MSPFYIILGAYPGIWGLTWSEASTYELSTYPSLKYDKGTKEKL